MRHSLLRNQILNLISEGFYLSPSGGIIVRLMSSRAVLRATMARIGISSSWGSCYFISILNVGGPLGLKAILTIVVSLENILCWNLVKSALDKEDNSVPVYSPFFNFFLFVTLMCDVFI